MAKAQPVIIGRCRCPVCESPKASLRVSEKQLAYVCCNTCNSQVFARSDSSDERLRGRRVDDQPEAEPVRTEPTPEPVRTEAAKPAPVQAKPAPSPALPEAVATAPAKPAWGIGSW